jgi:hypothetical protein
LRPAGLTLAKSAIDLITAIIKARSEGVKRGDRPADSVELIIRRIEDSSGGFREETALRIGCNTPIDRQVIEKQIAKALERLIEPSEPAQSKQQPGRKAAKRTTAKRSPRRG